MNKNKKSTLTKKVLRLLLVFALVLTEATTTVTPVLAETVSETVSATVNGVKYTVYIEQGTAQLTVGNKAMFLTKDNVAETAAIDKYGTAWVITHSGRCIGYNYGLQKEQPGITVHTYVKNACKFVFTGEYASSIETTTGQVELPDLEGFKKIAGISSNNTGNNGSSNTSNTSNNTTNNGSSNTSNTSNNTTNNSSNNTGNTSINNNIVVTKTTASCKTVTIIVTNGVGQVLVDNKLTNLPDKNICEIGIDSNGTIIYILSDKNAKWFNPFLQMTESKLLSNNANCLVKDSKDYATGIVANSTLMAIPTLEQQKTAVGVTNTTSTTNIDKSRVVPKGTNTFVVYDKNNKQLYKYSFTKGALTLKKGKTTKKYKTYVRVGVLRSNNLLLTTKKGSLVVLNYKTGKKTCVYSYSDCGKVKKYSYDSVGHYTSAYTNNGTTIDLNNY